MSCDVGEVTERLENEQSSNSPTLNIKGRSKMKRTGWRMSCDVCEVTERLENEQSS